HGGYKRQRLHVRGKAAPTTTTERPFIRVWNSFVRSVQPNFSLRNLTNPLVNLFNDGTANIIETPPVFVQSIDPEEQQQFQNVEVDRPQSSNKKKRKRRKQQKRRPVIDSEEFYDPYDYYGAPPAQPSLLPQAQPMFFFDTNSGSYYGVQRFRPEDFDDQRNYYNQFYGSGLQSQSNEENGEEPEMEDEEPTPLAKLNTKKVTLLRPLTLLVQTTDDKNDVNAAAVEESASTEDNTTTEPSAGDSEDAEASYSSLSESMRNALGTYMRDDHLNRQRQRHEVSAAAESSVSVTPRHRHGYFRLRAW
ncbi:uncharacterized protein Dwil_GK22704, partial [Drosophila willistoni]